MTPLWPLESGALQLNSTYVDPTLVMTKLSGGAVGPVEKLT